MKKFLCYFAIIILMLLIAIPPLTRIFYKKNEVSEVVRDVYALLTCTKDSYTISQSYKNDEPLSIKFIRPMIDDDLKQNEENNKIEYVLNIELKKIGDSTHDDEKQLSSYVVQYQNFDLNQLSGLSDFRLSLDNQISYYEQNGFSCNKMIQ